MAGVRIASIEFTAPPAPRQLPLSVERHSVSPFYDTECRTTLQGGRYNGRHVPRASSLAGGHGAADGRLGVFSGSEAALFSLRWPDRRAMEKGSSPQRIAVDLLGDPDRLLSAVLFWNLTVNLAYFALASVVALRLEHRSEDEHASAVAFGFLALLAIIFCGEMLPKSLGVLAARSISTLVAIPLGGGGAAGRSAHALLARRDAALATADLAPL
jgi:hypothetical protein